MTGIEYIVDLINREGFYALAGADGCACGEIELQSVRVAVHCHRTGHYQENDICECEYSGIHIIADGVEKYADQYNLIGKAIQASELYDLKEAPIVLHESD